MMGTAPNFAPALFESLLNAVEAENPGRTLGVVAFIVEYDSPPVVMANIPPDQVQDCLAWLYDHYALASVRDWERGMPRDS